MPNINLKKMELKPKFSLALPVETAKFKDKVNNFNGTIKLAVDNPEEFVGLIERLGPVPVLTIATRDYKEKSIYCDLNDPLTFRYEHVGFITKAEITDIGELWASFEDKWFVSGPPTGEK